MSIERRRDRRAPGTIVLLLGLLVLAPVAWGTDEDAREKAPATESQEAEKAPRAGAESAEEPAADAKAETAEEASQADPDEELDPSFNTVEDVQAFLGAPESLWTVPPAPVGEVIWRDASAAPASAR